LTALAGARVVGEHRHPALVERFNAIEGELTTSTRAFCIKARRPSSSPAYGNRRRFPNDSLKGFGGNTKAIWNAYSFNLRDFR
jgi:hypothetical protein